MTLDQIAAGTVPSRFGPVPAHPALDRLRVVLDETIAPAATITDASGVPASHLAALAATGLFGLAIPRAYGGLGAPPEVVTEACELLAGACPSTYLIASQHMTPIRWILDGGGPLLDLLPALAKGELIGGAAYGHLRSWPARRTVSARRTPGGWRFDGVAPWFSGAGLVDVVLLAAVAETEHSIVFAVVDLPQPSRIDAVPLDLAAIGGSRTATLRVNDLFVPDERVVQVVDLDEWRAGDALDGPVTAPGAVGLARAAMEYALAHRPDSPALHALADEVTFIRALGVGTSSAADAADLGRDRFYWRAQSINLAVRATNAAIVARGGAALLADDPAQVWARAALFLQVRGLSEPIRAAHLSQLADPHRHASAEPSPAGPFSEGSHMLTEPHSRVEPAASAQHSGPSKGRRAWFGRLLPFTLPVLLVVTWQVAAQLHWIDTVLIPSPQQVLRALVEAAGDGSLWDNAQASLLRWGSGFALGGGLGVMFGSLVGLFRRAEQILDSTFQMLRTVPHLGLMPLLILWLGLGESPKLVMVGLASFFPLYLNTMAGIRNVDRKLVEVGRVHGLGTVELLRRVVLPAALPSILVGARYGLGSAWVGLIVAELMGATSGLGFMLSEGQALSRVDIVVGGLIIFAIAGKLVDALVRAAERRFLHSRDTYQGV